LRQQRIRKMMKERIASQSSHNKNPEKKLPKKSMANLEAINKRHEEQYI
jgi:hypothetical protein